MYNICGKIPSISKIKYFAKMHNVGYKKIYKYFYDYQRRIIRIQKEESEDRMESNLINQPEPRIEYLNRIVIHKELRLSAI
jgi:replication-associated recombination protein RarA